MTKTLPQSFYTREDVVQLARDLLGKILITRIDDQLTSGMIVETEAYRAPDDKACHAYNNRYTERTKTMFKQGGRSYVYICYGIHHLFNVVTGPVGMAHAVLIRAVEPVQGKEVMLRRRGMIKSSKELCNGPGKFTVAMGITRNYNNHSLLQANNQIWIEDRGHYIKASGILHGPRVGMRTAGECSNWPWRFRIKGNPWTSRPHNVYYHL